ncbi:MAG: DUF5683 domain-containing protein [Bacteroidota bacterium]|nr:DUF5683 domain-containing protein [Bacteroidota bacterium]
MKKFASGTMKIIHSAFFIAVLFSFVLTKTVISQNSFESKKNIFSFDKIQMKDLGKELSLISLKDSANDKPISKGVFKMKKSPLRAVAYSAILPGAGQFYNESYWKIPVIAGLGSYFVYELILNNNRYLDYKEQYISSQTPQNPSGNLQLQSLREFYRDQRDNFIIYSLILYLVNLVDAYVDAQLYDFDVSDNIKFGVLKKEKIFKFSYIF